MRDGSMRQAASPAECHAEVDPAMRCRGTGDEDTSAGDDSQVRHSTLEGEAAAAAAGGSHSLVAEGQVASNRGHGAMHNARLLGGREDEEVPSAEKCQHSKVDKRLWPKRHS